MKPLTDNSISRVGRRAARRRGMSLLVVILLVSVATVVSYAVLRSQSTASRIQANADLRASAREAAASGLTYGLRQMHNAEWQGVDTSETRTLGPTERFTVSFAAGDKSLKPGQADYGDYPYRVTVESTGYAKDPADANRTASYTIRAVVRLIPRALSTWPDFADDTEPFWPVDWKKMEGYAFYQTKQEDVNLDLPCQLRGTVRFQAKVYVGDHYLAFSTSNYNPWRSYLTGLKQMYSSGLPDYRPLNETVHAPLSSFDSLYKIYFYTYLRSALGFSFTEKSPDETASDWVKPDDLETYQIYPGGPVYDIPALGGIPPGTSLQPNPITNPLGLFQQSGGCALEGNVAVRGTLFCDGEIKFLGTAQFTSVDMPPLHGSDEPVRMPVLSADKLTVESTSATTIEGLVAVFDTLEIKKSPTTLPFNLTGRLVTKKLYIREREPWELADWTDLYNQWRTETSGSVPFPSWLQQPPRGYNPAPQITIGPDSTPVQYDWNDWDNPIYVPHDDDVTDESSQPGLRWEMLQWRENP
ncbi:MAG: hypothetical protein JW719_11360 [Pirellulales bacterium]|nr:hypothetical protein [Pirellulales bacterium]